jgi:hypothetical protein
MKGHKMERYTRRDTEMAFARLADAVGAKIADPAWKITDKRRLGAWTLDHNGVYGGYVIAAYVSDSHYSDDPRPQTYTAETHPMGDRRHNARDFAQMCHFAARAIEASRGGSGSTREIRKRYAPRKAAA